MSYFRFGTITATMVLTSVSLWAQAGAQTEDVGEVDAYAGTGFGPIGGRSWFGAATGIYISKYAVALVDVSYLRLGYETFRRPSPAATASHLYDFNFTIQIQIPVGRRWAPYGLAGAPVLYNSFRIESVRPDGTTHIAGERDFKFGFETGAGVRYFVGHNWGVRGEYRYTVSTLNFSRISVGVFYQFEGAWPFLPSAKRGHGQVTY